MKIGHWIVFLMAITFVLATVSAFAAGDSYVVIKDKNGVCRYQGRQQNACDYSGSFQNKGRS